MNWDRIAMVSDATAAIRHERAAAKAHRALKATLPGWKYSVHEQYAYAHGSQASGMASGHYAGQTLFSNRHCDGVHPVTVAE